MVRVRVRVRARVRARVRVWVRVRVRAWLGLGSARTARALVSSSAAVRDAHCACDREGCALWVGGARGVEGSAARAMHPNSKHGHSECRKPAAASIAMVRVGRLLPLTSAP